MLFSAARQRFLFPNASIDLSGIKSCLDVLSFCGTIDTVPYEYVQSLTPYYAKLQDRGGASSSPDDVPGISAASMDIADFSPVTDKDIISRELLEMMSSPFGFKQVDSGSSVPALREMSSLMSSSGTNAAQMQNLRPEHGLSLPSLSEAIPFAILNSQDLPSLRPEFRIQKEEEEQVRYNLETDPERLYQFFQCSF